MADIKTPEERSINMSKIRSKNTKPEEYIRKGLYSRGYRYRKNYNRITGTPDAWFARYNVALFVNGCFWHRHKGCKYAYTPKSRVSFWTDKFKKNIERDEYVKRDLGKQGIRILIIWECTVKNMLKSEEYAEGIFRETESFLGSNERYMEL